MGEIRVGTASWTDKTLIGSGWYPPEADTPEKRLRFYARQFPLVEADSSYYALPAEQTAAMWAERTPAGFTFNVKAFSLFTQHPTPLRALPVDLRETAGKSGKDRIYLSDVDPDVAGQAWDRFLAADIHERFGYRYTGAELDEWAAQTRRLAADATVTHVLFNNCYRDSARVNARQLTELLEGLACPRVRTSTSVRRCGTMSAT